MVTIGITSQNITCSYNLLKIRRNMPRNTAPSRSWREKHFRDKNVGFAAVKFKENAFAAY